MAAGNPDEALQNAIQAVDHAATALEKAKRAAEKAGLKTGCRTHPNPDDADFADKQAVADRAAHAAWEDLADAAEDAEAAAVFAAIVARQAAEALRKAEPAFAGIDVEALKTLASMKSAA
jgi:hypothetical protein